MPDYPQAFQTMLRDAVGDRFDAVERALRTDAPVVSLRINPARENALARLPAKPLSRVAWEPNGYYMEPGFRPGRDIAHTAGAYYMQEASAMASARALDARPGERVLDLCAAPGGKSGQIASALAGTGLLIANEPDAARSRVLASNLERLGAQNAVVTQMFPQALAEKWPEYFDAVLVDAPCSGEGMFRRDPNAVGEWSPARVAGCQARQRAILESAAKLVAPGGRLVYSTCTFNRLENEDNAEWFLTAHPDYRALDFSLPGVGVSVAGRLRLLPGIIQGEGHFVAAFRKSGKAPAREALAVPRPSARFSLLADTLPGIWTEPFSRMRLIETGAYLVALPLETPDLAGVAVVKPGVTLCELGKNYCKPAHALAMAINACDREFPMTDMQARAYLAGVALETDLSGWARATWNKLPLGLGKGANGSFKNHLPKGLRQV